MQRPVQAENMANGRMYERKTTTWSADLGGRRRLSEHMTAYNDLASGTGGK